MLSEIFVPKPHAAFQNLKDNWRHLLRWVPQGDCDGSGGSIGKICRYFSSQNTSQKPVVVKIKAHANGFTFLINSGSPCIIVYIIPKTAKKYHVNVNLPQLQGADYSYTSSQEFDQKLKTLQQLQSAQATGLAIRTNIAELQGPDWKRFLNWHCFLLVGGSF